MSVTSKSNCLLNPVQKISLILCIILNLEYSVNGERKYAVQLGDPPTLPDHYEYNNDYQEAIDKPALVNAVKGMCKKCS